MSNLEYLTQARKLLTEDYKSKHSDEYSNWLARHQNSWQQPHIVVPFPPFIVSSALAPFKATVSAPSEEAIVAKALELYKQFNPELVKTTEKIAEPVVEPVIEETPITSVVEEPVVEEPVVEEPVVEELVVEPVIEEIPITSVVEDPVGESVVETPLKTNDAIYKIFQEPIVEAPSFVPTTEPLPPTIESALNVVPQPAEELARVKASGRILPSVLQRLQDMKDKWSTTGDKNV